MLNIHSCKTSEHPEVSVTQNEYEQLHNRVNQGTFKNALQIARQQVLGSQIKLEQRRYQDAFQLPISRNIFGLYTIRVTINYIPCTFILDTGAQISGLREEKIKALHVKESGSFMSVGSIGGKERSMKGLIADQFSFGAIEYRNFPLISLGAKNFNFRVGKYDLFSFDGILGWDVLSTIDFEFDDIAKQFKVLKNQYTFPYQNMIHGGFPTFIMKRADGELSLFGFDSGSRVSWIGEAAIERCEFEVVKEASALGFGVHGLEKLDVKIIKEANLFLYKGKIQLRHVNTGRTNLFPHFAYDGVLGNEIFKGRRLRILNSKQMVLIR